jgi:hypothetical protein
MSRLRLAVAASVGVLGAIAITVSLVAGTPASALGKTSAAAAVLPLATTGAASNTTVDSATVSGTVNPEGKPATYFFEYGSTASYGLQTAPAGAGSGTGSVAISAHLTGLQAGQTYHYRLVAKTPAGTGVGADATLSTTAATSAVQLMGHEGFVSPGDIVGIELGCFGPAACSGTFKVTVNGAEIGSASFAEASNTGGFVNIRLSATGVQELKANQPNHLLHAVVTVTTSSGQSVTGTFGLARWYWKDLSK